MLDLSGGTIVYLSCGVIDIRKSYNGLVVVIKLKIHLAHTPLYVCFLQPQAHFYQDSL